MSVLGSTGGVGASGRVCLGGGVCPKRGYVLRWGGITGNTPKRNLGSGIPPETGRDMGPGIPIAHRKGPETTDAPPPTHTHTRRDLRPGIPPVNRHMYENITFLELLLRAVIMPKYKCPLYLQCRIPFFSHLLLSLLAT